MTYPQTPGYKDQDTSRLAAIAMTLRAGTLKSRCYQVLLASKSGMTADQVADALGETVLAIRPRITELYQMGLIFDTSERRLNISRMTAKVWKTFPVQMELF